MPDHARPVPTQPEPPDIATSRRELTALIDAPLTLDDRLAAAEALSVLSDVTPPYPPMRAAARPRQPSTADAAFAAVSRRLRAAVDAAVTVEEALRCARALTVLAQRPLADPPSETDDVEDRRGRR